MLNKKEVEYESHEWALVDYKIQTITGKSSLKIISLYRYNNQEETQQVSQNILRILQLKQLFRSLTLTATI